MYHLHGSQEPEISYGSAEYEHEAMRWLDVVKDYNCEIIYHIEKANVVANALRHKADSARIQGLCLRSKRRC